MKMTPIKAAIPLSCPQCKSELRQSEHSLECDRCNRQWRVVSGVPYIVEDAPYWGESGLPQEVMQEILQEMETRDWHSVIRDHASGAVRDRYRFIADTGRARWHEKLQLGPESLVLDLGAGLGTASEALAQRDAQVYAVEQVEERIQFMRLRFQQAGCENVRLFRASADCLPFPDHSFDLVVLNGVLEWMPFSRKHENPRIAQLHYLRKACALLKPGGTLYLGIENRMNYPLLLGASDPHILLPWVAVLPRPLADLLTRRKTGDRYRPYIYSHWGYRKLLREAGFREVEIYAALPSYSNPQRMLNLKERGGDLAEELWPTHNPISKLLKRAAIRSDWLKYFGPAYVIFARR